MGDKVWNLRQLLAEMLDEYDKGRIRPVTLKMVREALRETDSSDWLRPRIEYRPSRDRTPRQW